MDVVDGGVDRGQNPRATMERDSDDKIAEPSWFSPKKLLFVFCVVNLINYIDRGAIASNGVNGSLGTCTSTGTCSAGSGIQGDFNLSNFQDGVLSSAFMVGLLVASPIFASVAKSVNPFRLIGIGLSIWTLAVVGCGLSFDFWSITFCRMFVGVGEASFVSLAAPFIDDNAPQAQKSAWLAMFYMCIPTGYALGYVYGGLVGSVLPWRAAFWGEAILMLPFAVLGFVIKPLHLKGASSKLQNTHTMLLIDLNLFLMSLLVWLPSGFAPDDKGKNRTDNLNVLPTGYGFSAVLKDLKLLLVDKVYVTNILGYIAYNFVLGAYSYWGPKAGYNIYKMENADMIFGGITVICGIVGTLSGGVVLDFMDATISNAFKLLSVSTFIGGLFCFAAFCFKSMYAFLALFAVGELLVFATQGPVNFIVLHCVKPSLRPLAMAMSTVSIHIFGDVPSSPLVGVLQDYVNNWRVTALVLTFVLFPAAAIWFIGIFLNSVDRYNEDSEPDAVTRESAVAPLLEEA
ncbi:probable sphingolipid transporter spinster homolog 2 isoform X1 [Brassica napus]|uniref:probable sphingolipid transporter spinster homolog 2 isoform X1 n=1 Tax=Brassica napus TaxID=3708 RepID=UPI000BBE7303|nr:probable sphingolipid transporter spinster homolog 2 isoform X1 [Brassica napus]